MPMFVLNRNYAHSSVYGHNIIFTKGEPTFVPPICIPEAVAFGAICVDGPVDVLPPEVQAQIPLVGEEREQMIMAAFDDIEVKNDRAEFTAAGAPKLTVVKSVSGINDLDTKEVTAAWQKRKELKAT